MNQRMLNLLKLGAAFLLLLLLVGGCALRQASSRIVVPGAGSLALPKDSKFNVLCYEQTPVLLSSNLVGYQVRLIITNGAFTMNPAVIDKATAHDIGLLNAGGQLILQGAGLAVPK